MDETKEGIEYQRVGSSSLSPLLQFNSCQFYKEDLTMKCLSVIRYMLFSNFCKLVIFRVCLSFPPHRFLHGQLGMKILCWNPTLKQREGRAGLRHGIKVKCSNFSKVRELMRIVGLISWWFVLFTGNWWTFEWKFDSGGWRCCIARTGRNDKGCIYLHYTVYLHYCDKTIIYQNV